MTNGEKNIEVKHKGLFTCDKSGNQLNREKSTG